MINQETEHIRTQSDATQEVTQM